jgi:hypothetical protein
MKFFIRLLFILFILIGSKAFSADFLIYESRSVAAVGKPYSLRYMFKERVVTCQLKLNWGDGDIFYVYINNANTPDKLHFESTHDYNSPGQYQISIDGDNNNRYCYGNESMIVNVDGGTKNILPAAIVEKQIVQIPNTPAKNNLKQVTTNPLDQVKKTSGNEVWISFNPSITIQERQFCRIVENFRTESALAAQSKNAIKVNETYKSFVQGLNSLLPDGKFQGWVMRTVAVDQAADGSAEVLLELPCNVYVGSNACDTNPKNFYGTAPEGSRMYSELAKMNVGDFALTSGQFVYSDEKAFDKKRSVASFRYMKAAAHCKAKEVSTDSDFFGLKLDVISTIK